MIYFASDVHLGGGDPAATRAVERRFLVWLDFAARNAEAIFLVGDIFDFWFEYPNKIPPGFDPILHKLAELTGRGIRVVFFTGNHDMWTGDYLPSQCGVEIYNEPQTLELHGRRLFIAHGDNIRIDELGVKLLNRLFRSKFVRRLVTKFISYDTLIRFGHWWSSRSRKAHTVPDPKVIEPLIAYARDYAAEHADRPVDHFVFGHMHVAHDYRDGALHTIHLGCWEKKPAYAVLDNSGDLTLKPLDE